MKINLIHNTLQVSNNFQFLRTWKRGWRKANRGCAETVWAQAVKFLIGAEQLRSKLTAQQQWAISIHINYA